MMRPAMCEPSPVSLPLMECWLVRPARHAGARSSRRPRRHRQRRRRSRSCGGRASPRGFSAAWPRGFGIAERGRRNAASPLPVLLALEIICLSVAERETEDIELGLFIDLELDQTLRNWA